MVPFIIFIIAFILVLWAGKILPSALGGIAKILGLSEFVTAFIFIAFATSIPELFVGISSALQGIPEISLGNIMGANLFNLTFVIGASVLFAGSIKGDGKISSQNFWLIFLIALLPVLLAADGIISRGDGIILLVVFGLYLTKLFRDKEYFHKEMNDNVRASRRLPNHISRYISQFIGGITLLLLSAFALIWSAKALVGDYFHDDFILFGVIFVAVGTALPELIFGIQASRKGHSSAMLGNALGSIAFNAAAVVGIVALINPIEIVFNFSFILISVFLLVAFLLFHLFVYTNHRINRKEGFVLLALYLVFVITSLLL